jgi:hypothetical protein
MKLPPGYVPGSGVHKATAYGGFGERLMKRMGWEQGEGLGKDKKGMTKALEVKLKDDTIGVSWTTVVRGCLWTDMHTRCLWTDEY